ncbi:Na+/H+ antiporter subunit E [Methylonatrum kenyense]|uniref:Na+/H+ antiporter subunit E n=1 Tax=Methylonatrum kenyense TaxID=455253 RepID=UPI0020C1434D|nr:Na+/H+ antiporter subunit E [Methylonatrum kenyense]MCK8517103.1 Na+/H+ antiporter subunit E [Methylonatrum kenyense]
MTLLIWNILLAFAWIALTGNFDARGLIVGFIFGYFTLLVISRASGRRPTYVRKVPQTIGFALFYIWELIKSNIRVAVEVLTPTHTMKPGVIGLKLECQSDAAITILANLITMTPGTLSLDVSSDKKVLFIHGMYIDDEEQLRAELKDLQRRVMELLDETGESNG